MHLLEKNRWNQLVEKPLSWADWIIFFLIAVLCFFTFQQADLLHTGGSSFAYLNGHILDFYDYNVQYMSGNNYLPSTYILFAIWNIPIKLLGLVAVPTMTVSIGVIMWYKLLPTLFYLFSGYWIYKIGMEMGLEYKKSKLCAYAFLTTPIAFFSQFIFGQYDIFTVFFVLIGLYYYVKKANYKFILFFGLAITFKYFALLIFIPLLLLCEKNILKLIRSLICVMLPYIIEVGFYIMSQAFRTGVFGFGAIKYILIASINIGFAQVSIFIIGWIVLCACAFFKETESDKETIKWALYFSNIVTFLLFGLTMWHPQWLLFAVPFWVLSTFINKKSDIFLLIDILLMLLFIVFTINFWQNGVDQSLINYGIFGKYTFRIIGNQLTMSDLYIIKNSNLIFSFFSAILLVSVIFKHPKYCLENFNESIDKYWNIVRTRFIVGVSLFIVPAFICFAACFILPGPIFSVPIQDMTIINATNNTQIAQVFRADGDADTITEVEVQIGTYMRVNHSNLQMIISDYETGAELYKTDIDVENLTDNAFEEIKVPNIAIERGKQYAICFVASNTTDSDYVAIYRTVHNLNEPAGYAVVDGKKQDYNLNIHILGK